MSEPDEAMVEAVRRAIHTADNEWASAPKTEPHEPWDLYVAKAVASVPVVRDALARDGRAGCHAITGDGGTTYCPLAEANMRAVARDAQVREIVREPSVFDGYKPTPAEKAAKCDRIAALYPSPGDRDDSEEQR